MGAASPRSRVSARGQGDGTTKMSAEIGENRGDVMVRQAPPSDTKPPYSAGSERCMPRGPGRCLGGQRGGIGGKDVFPLAT